MSNKVNDFPQYRMIKERKVYYKIISAKEFIEISWIGDKQFTYKIEAKQYPEMLRIMDMLNFETPYEALTEGLEVFFQ